jgi:membrane protease YdiL (CAAX protease family)
MERPAFLPVAVIASPRLDLPVAIGVWLLGLGWVARTGNWTPLAVAAIAAAGRLVAHDPTTRQLLVPTRAAVAAGVLGAAAMIAATYALFEPVSRAFPGVAAETRALRQVLEARGYGPVALAAVLPAVAASEEILWRGRLLSAAEGAPRLVQLGRALAYTAVYAAAHAASGSPLLPMVALVCGCGWALLRVAAGSLWPAVIAHVAWDVAVLVLWPPG